MNCFVEEAIKQAEKSIMKNRYGAVIIYRNKVISTGYNYHKHINTDNKSCLLCC